MAEITLNPTQLTELLKAAIGETQLKELLKAAILELLQEQKEEFSEVLTEALEDIWMKNAIQEGENTEIVSREQIFQILKRQP
ncbi:MAG: hypothetical protein EBE86_032400 [Hormoscilla sp. GUM202]|nr:hypothetical protein [Hormoscilla sp. GUM202]